VLSDEQPEPGTEYQREQHDRDKYPDIQKNDKCHDENQESDDPEEGYVPGFLFDLRYQLICFRNPVSKKEQF
jgi:hypothetical protein